VRAALLAIGVANGALACSVYDESLRQGSAAPVAAGGADGGDSGAPAGAGGAGTGGAGAGASSGGAGSSIGGDLVDAGAPGTAGDDSSQPTAGAATGGGAGGANGGTGGGVVSAGAAGMLPSGGSNGGGGATGAGGAAATELGFGKPTTASTQQPANPSGSGNDAQIATRWSATTAAVPQWWRVDLGANHSVTQVSVQFEFADRKYTYAVETSTDDASYTARANVVDGIGAVQVVPIPGNVSARYVRITCTSTVPGVDPMTGMSRPTWVSFWELSVLGN